MQNPSSTAPSLETNTYIIHDKVADQKYVTKHLLGKGGFAKCFLVKKLQDQMEGEENAAKIVDKKSLLKPKTKQKLGTEIKIHQSLKHEHIVAFKTFFEDRHNVYIMLEVCHCKSMMELIQKKKRLTEIEAKYLMIQLLQGVKYMHSMRVIHRDLKLGNIFLDHNMHAKIGDFGLAAQLEYDEERKRTICGTPNYIAPEILTSSQEGHSYEVDVWSLGVILYTLLIGKPPFETASLKTTYSKIKSNSYSFPYNIPISDEARDLITRILTSNPRDRPTIDQILNHNFFTMETRDYRVCPDLLREYAMKETGRVPTYVPLDYHRYMPNAAYITSDSTPQILNASHSERLPFQPIHSNTISNRVSYPSNTMQQQTNIPFHQQVKGRQNNQSNQNIPTVPNQSNQQSENICASLAQMKLKENCNINSSIHAISTPTVWVSQWADFSQKYGLAYRMNTNQTGTHFNDATKMIWFHDSNIVHYYERKKTPEGSYDEKQIYHIDSYPESLKKKITLIKYFRQYLEKSNAKPEEMDQVEGIESSDSVSIYVKRWMRTKHAVIFRLSNKTVQVCFRDNTEIILSSEAKLVTYKDEKQDKETFSLSKFIEVHNPEVAKRLKYTKEILKKLISDQKVM